LKGETTVRSTKRHKPVTKKAALAIEWAAGYVTVHDADGHCAGHIFIARNEFSAFDANERAVGVFKSRDAAREAIASARQQ
jgi:hypothetical protein